jgi:hypothetical protein
MAEPARRLWTLEEFLAIRVAALTVANHPGNHGRMVWRQSVAAAETSGERARI